MLGKDLDLSTKIAKKGGQVKAIHAEACALIIQHYAFQGNETAQYSLAKFAAIGVETWIRSVTVGQQLNEPSSDTLPDLAERIEGLESLRSEIFSIRRRLLTCKGYMEILLGSLPFNKDEVAKHLAIGVMSANLLTLMENSVESVQTIEFRVRLTKTDLEEQKTEIVQRLSQG